MVLERPDEQVKDNSPESEVGEPDEHRNRDLEGTRFGAVFAVELTQALRQNANPLPPLTGGLVLLKHLSLLTSGVSDGHSTGSGSVLHTTAGSTSTAPARYARTGMSSGSWLLLALDGLVLATRHDCHEDGVSVPSPSVGVVLPVPVSRRRRMRISFSLLIVDHFQHN